MYKLGLDLGHSNIKITTMLAGNLINKNIRSLYDTTGFSNENLVEIDGEKIYFGSGSSLSNGDKTRRRYVKHTLLLAVSKVFGSQSTPIDIELAVGLPLNIYKSDKKQKYTNDLTELFNGVVSGMVAGNQVMVNVVRIKVCAEGHSAFIALKDDLTENECVVIDIGHGTTDIVYMIKSEKWKAESVETIQTGFGEIYEAIANEHLNKGGTPLDVETVEKRVMYDLKLKNNDGTIRARDYLYVAEPIINDVLDKISKQFNDFDSIPCLIVGSGSSLLKDYIRLDNVKIYDGDKAMYSNSIGYYCQL